MIFAIIILSIIFLLCVCVCFYFAWELYIQRYSKRDVAIVDKVIKEAHSWKPNGWRYKAYTHITAQGEQIEKKLSFWVSEGPINNESEDYKIPVFIYTKRNGKNTFFVEESKSLLWFLIISCGVLALIFAIVIGLVAFYN